MLGVVYATDNHAIEVKSSPAPRNDGRQADGYGMKIATRRVLRLDGKGPWRRVYCTVFSNSGSLWIMFRGEKLFLHDWDLSEGVSRAVVGCWI